MYEVGQIISTQPINGLQIRKPLKGYPIEVLSISLEQGGTLPEHTSPKHAFLVVLEGALDFYIQGRKLHLERFEDISFPKEVPHWVEAREDSRFLIIR